MMYSKILNRTTCLILGLTAILASCNKNDDDQKWITPPSTGATMTLQGGAGEANAENSVFVDFSANEQFSINRHSWHLAFNCGSDFGVFLNSTTISRAKEAIGITVNDSLSDEILEPYAAALAMTMGGSSSMDIVDAFDQSIAGTVIKEGKTYIYRNEDAEQPFYKINVTKKDDNTYTVLYSEWNSSVVKSADIRKDTKYKVIGFSLTDEKSVVVEKADWDMVWGRNTYVSAMAPNVPSAMADMVFINHKAGVKAAEILEVDIAYENYVDTNLMSTTLSSDVGSIGDKWRGTSGMPPVMSVRPNRYYILQDTDGNIYKLKFLAIGGADGAIRGYPQLKFDLIKTKN